MLEFLPYMVALNTWFVIVGTVGYHDDGIDNTMACRYLVSASAKPRWLCHFYIFSILAFRCWLSDVRLKSIRCSSALWAIYIYNFYRGNAKLDMPFWFYFDISIPMLARYSGRRRIDMDSIQFGNLRGILYYGKLFQFKWLDWTHGGYMEVTRIFSYFYVWQEFSICSLNVAVKHRLVTDIYTKR